jgi:hypothetical protein
MLLIFQQKTAEALPTVEQRFQNPVSFRTTGQERAKAPKAAQGGLRGSKGDERRKESGKKAERKRKENAG